MSSCRIVQQQYLFSRPAHMDKIYPPSPFLPFSFQRYICILGVHFLSFLSQKKRRIFTVVSTHCSGFGGCISFWVRTANKTVEATWVWRCRFCAYILYGMYTRFPYVKILFYCVTSGSRMKVVPCVPLLPFLEGVPVWVGSVGSVFWDCRWGCQGVNREKKETKIRGKRRREEKAGIS